MDNKDLQKLLDSLDEGPLGKPEVYWDRVTRALNLTADKTILEKRGEKISKALKGKTYNASHAHKRMKPIKAYKVIKYRKATKKETAAILEKQFVGKFNNSYEAAKELGLVQGDIANVLRPKSATITTKGYTFEYVK